MRSLDELNRLLTVMTVVVRNVERRQIDGEHRQIGAPPGCVCVIYVADGACRATLPRRSTRELDAGAMLLLPAGVEASFVPSQADDGGVTLIVGVAALQLSGSSLFDRARVPIFCDLAHSRLVRPSMDELLRLAADDHSALGDRALANSLMKTCILILLQDFFTRPGIDHKIVSALADDRLAGVIAAVLERPEAAHGLQVMADRAGLSRSTFSRLFVQAMGQSPSEFVARTRLYHGAEILRTSKAPIKSVAIGVGFQSRSHFSRAFRDAYGEDPTAYRQRHAGTRSTPVPQDLKRISVPAGASSPP